MKIQKPRRLTKADYPDSPEWIQPIFQVLNNIFEKLVLALQNNLTFGDNFRSEIREIEIADDTSTPVQLQRLQRNPIGVELIDPGVFEYPKFTWEISSSEDLTINIKVKYDAAPAENPTIRIRITGE